MKILIPRGVSGLGALGPYPPNSMLKPGMMWLRYMALNQYGKPSTKLQETRCPSPAPWGCWMWKGYAWGQVPTTGEFQNVPTRPKAPTAAEIQQKCESAYAGWKSRNPALATCLNSADRAAFMSLCTAAWQGQLDAATVEVRWNQRVHDRCVDKCRAAYAAWREAHPRRAACLPGNARAKFVDLCLKALRGEITGAQRDKTWTAYVSKMCAEAGQPDGGGGAGTPGPSDVDAPVPTKPVLEDTPDVAESPDGLPDGSGVRRGDELVDSIVKGDGMPEGNGDDAGEADKGLLRRIGPIVGIGLLLAVGGVSWWRYSIKKKGVRR